MTKWMPWERDEHNHYRDAADEIESTWRQRAAGIHPVRPEDNIWLGTIKPMGAPLPPVDAAWQGLVARANAAAARDRLHRSIIAVAASVALIAAVVAAGWWILTH
jgi:hypothetical protein